MISAPQRNIDRSVELRSGWFLGQKNLPSLEVHVLAHVHRLQRQRYHSLHNYWDGLTVPRQRLPLARGDG